MKNWAVEQERQEKARQFCVTFSVTHFVLLRRHKATKYVILTSADPVAKWLIGCLSLQESAGIQS